MAKIKGTISARMKPNGEVEVRYRGNPSLRETAESTGYALANALAMQYGYSGKPTVIFIDKDLTKKLSQ